MQQVMLIAIAGSLGCVTRYGMSTLVYNLTNDVYPWGTLFVNLTGSFLIGVLAELFDTALIPSPLRSAATIGFVGGYTTFSTYTLETLNLLREGEFGLATMNVLASNVFGVACTALGIYSCRLAITLWP